MANKLGIGHMFWSLFLSDKIKMEAPSEIAFEAKSQIRETALSSESSPSFMSNKIGIVQVENSFFPICLIVSNSLLDKMGSWSFNCLQCSGLASSIFSLRPIKVSTEVTSSSLIASSGGLLT